MFLPCDDTKGLECQDTNGQVTGLTRGSEGVCKPPAYSRTCFVKGEVYNSGDQFNPEGQCEVTCVCVNGDIGCYPTCPKNQNEPPTEVNSLLYKYFVKGNTKMSRSRKACESTS